MTKQKRWQRVGAMLDIPSDITADVARVTILGKTELSVENHGGIIEYSGELLRLRINGGELRISGRELMLTLIAVEEVRVKGHITAVQYV